MPKSKKSVRRPKSSAIPNSALRTQYSIGPLDGITLHEDAGQPDRTVGTHGGTPLGAASQTSPEKVRDGVESVPTKLTSYYEDKAAGVWLYHNNCLEVLDAIAARHPEGRFDMIFADPPYFLSNGGITCHAGKMVSVHKGDWDQSRGWEWNHEFNTEWLRRCQRVLKPNGTLWVTGTHHVIFSVGFALQQLGFKILNDIAWEKPNPPPNLSCRYFTHSTETILWAAKNEKSKHVFNYQDMRKVTGKQMKTVWRKEEFTTNMVGTLSTASQTSPEIVGDGVESVPTARQSASHSTPAIGSATAGQPSTPNHQLSSVWTMTSPGNAEKSHGKHPTQKPVALVERCILASTNPGDLILDPFLGGGTTAVACIHLGRNFVGVELDLAHLTLATRRTDAEIITLWLRHFRVTVGISVVVIDCAMPPDTTPSPRGEGRGEGQRQGRGEGERAHQKNDLDLFSNLIDRSAPVSEKPEPQSERIFHETKFVFLSCAVVSSASVVHTTVDISITEAWAHAPTGKKRETTHIVRCETEILRIKCATG